METITKQPNMENIFQPFAHQAPQTAQWRSSLLNLKSKYIKDMSKPTKST